MRSIHHLIGLAALCLSAFLPRAGAQDAEVGTRESKTTSTYKEQVVVERTTTTREVAQVTRKTKDKYTCAIFVANRSPRIEDEKVLVMQDFLTGHVTDKGFKVIAREDVINAVKSYATEGPNKGDDALPGAKLDELLSNNTSALRLAQNMNADYVLVVTISSYGADKQRYVDPKQNIDLIGTRHQMKTTYRLLDGTLGGSTTAGVATTSLSDRIDPRVNAVERENLVDDLLDATAMDMSEMLGKAASQGAIEVVKADKSEATFEVFCGVADMVIPEIVRNEKGEYIVMAGRYRLESLAVTVELDGTVVGTSNAPIKAKPGLHKMRLRRNLFNDWEGTVNVKDGMNLQIAMEMSPEGLQEFVAMTQFLNGLKERQILTDAQARMWDGYAKQLEQSGYRVDKQIRRTINVDEKSPAANPNTGDGGVKVDVNINNDRDKKNDGNR